MILSSLTPPPTPIKGALLLYFWKDYETVCKTGTTLQIATEMAVNRRVSLFRSCGDNTTLILAQL